MKYLSIILLVFIICVFAEKIANNAHESREIVFSGIVSPKYDAPYKCIFPWHIGRKLKGFDIEGHDSFVCEWKFFWMGWNVEEQPS